MLTASNRPNLILIQRKIETSGTWNPTVAWVEFGRAWVSINPDRGREVFKGDQLSAVVTHTIRGEWMDLHQVDETMRIIYNDRHQYGPVADDSLVFDILAVMPNYDDRDDVMIQANLKPLRFGQLPPDTPQ